MEDMIHEPNGWYFYVHDHSCRIGPYRDPRECEKDYKQYETTGRISSDPVGKVGPKCSDCE
jgi:hypothetical protein